MEKKFKQNGKNIETGEEQLLALIKEAGEEARRKKREVMAQHCDRLREAIRKAATRNTLTYRVIHPS
uniref:Uncharacterized protein n=1 Tax=Candidatus Kentrum sp. LFY TaxID=2126342 RepID=A0A450UIT9_9GAMM|nr:MAG: hypothetical protein BECKLFY1418A_GA0070994_102324 [Candidatus Kentron sp. LFY]